jgi:hypothetical protein
MFNFSGLATPTSEKQLEAKDAEGNELYDGPVETDEQREELDAFLLEKLEELEGQLEGLQTSKAVSI